MTELRLHAIVEIPRGSSNENTLLLISPAAGGYAVRADVWCDRGEALVIIQDTRRGYRDRVA